VLLLLNEIPFGWFSLKWCEVSNNIKRENFFCDKNKKALIFSDEGKRLAKYSFFIYMN